MKFNVCLMVFTLLIFAASAFADIAVPNTAKPRSNVNASSQANNASNSGAANAAYIESLRYAWVSAEIDPAADAPRLVISRSMLAALNEIAENEKSSGGSTKTERNVAGVKTVISGLLVSLGLIITGVWLIRLKPGKKAGAVISAMVIFAIGGGGALIAYADAAPRIKGVETFTGRTFSLDVRKNGGAYDRFVRVEIGDADADFKLIVPVDSRDKKGNNKKDEEEE